MILDYPSMNDRSQCTNQVHVQQKKNGNTPTNLTTIQIILQITISAHCINKAL